MAYASLVAAACLQALVVAPPSGRPRDPRPYDGPLAVAVPSGDTKAPIVRAPDRGAGSPEPAPRDTDTGPTITSPRVRPPQPASSGTFGRPAVEAETGVRLRPALDLAIIVGAGAPSLALGLWVTPSLPASQQILGDVDEIGRFDRGALGRYAKAPATASDALLGVGIAVPVAYHAIEAALHRRGWSRARGRGFLPRFGTDLVLYAQVLAINGLLTQILKASIRRPRPYAYLDPAAVDADVREDLIADQMATDADWSFPSGHTSAVFAASTGGATLLTLELLGRSNWPIIAAWVGGTGIAATTAAMRVISGRHFPSDVVTSALIGSAVGVAVPLAHWRPARSGDIARRTPRWRRDLALAPMAAPRTMGLSLTGVLP